MINQQLLDYIKQQSQSGMSQEKIKSTLLATGWQEPDINEGLRAINTTPPSIAGTSMKVGSSGKALKIALISLGGAAMIGGGIYAYTQNFFINQEPIEQTNNIDNLEQTAMPVEKNQDINIPANTNKEETIIVATTKDCGIADDYNIGERMYENTRSSGSITSTVQNFDQVPSLVCMGNALLNNCQQAKLSSKSEFGTIHTEEIIGGNSETCTIKVTYGSVNDQDVEEKMYENSYIQCDYPVANIKGSGCLMLSNDACNYFGVKDSPAHVYMNTLGSMVFGAIVSPDNAGCTGNMIDQIKNYEE